MESLLAELDRKRKQLDSVPIVGQKTYFKRGDLSKVQAEEYRKQKNLTLEKKGLLKNVEPSDSGGEVNKTPPTKIKKLDLKYKNIEKSELCRRLRDLKEPIKLFGESHEDTCQRLRLIEMISNDEDKGLRNDFKAALDRVDQSYIAQLNTEGSSDSTNKAHDVKISHDALSIEELIELSQNIEKGNMQQSAQMVLEFLKHLSYLWGVDLNKRELHEKISISGKLSSAQYEQTMAYLKPLFRKLRSQSLTADILNALTGIVQNLIHREYVKASDLYLQMAIGNAPWPIGVTNPGIHARTGREKISTALVAHVLNDETQRKYIQALKRLMTFCQKKYTAAPSKCVEYQSIQ